MGTEGGTICVGGWGVPLARRGGRGRGLECGIQVRHGGLGALGCNFLFK